MDIHAATLTLDSHIDIRWPNPPDPLAEGVMRVDFPKMQRGGLRAAIFIAYVGQGKRDEAGHAAAAERVEAMLRHIQGRADGVARRFCATPDELEAAHAAGALAVLSAVENGYGMGHDLGAPARWRALGACYLTLTHDGHNDLADSARPQARLGDATVEHGGLSPLGRQAVAALNAAGMLIDVSHVAKSGMMQAAELSRSPIVATHTACRALCDHPRGIDDEQLDMLKSVGGLAQITAMPSFLQKVPEGTRNAASVETMVDHVDHAVRRIGLEHVGLSSDFDGGGAVEGWQNAAETANLTKALLRHGYGAREIGLLWSGNFLRVWRQAQAIAD
ncbi:membrane dipeptidase [Paeniroseomonas aquatica]|jgi:membrane dipeptidase|uniref:Membrane dipeptidase n=2 Tax=Paeniroseomonas aquatica TaxID=373043 RepID=A0ABT7ZZA0_9PROT|nr:membrane dipeptidase [Paeniroseomonas aquatica]MDN3562797.1 membrane dipeptidase [Paeniroseomonas aquatica]